ncbi:MAG TPA: hypothetical protein VF507_06145 [Pyrinomonadaceae bacterium]|jgi:hypothetical protein
MRSRPAFIRSKLIFAAVVCLLFPLEAAAQDGKQLVVPLESKGFVAFRVEAVSTGTRPASASPFEPQTIFNPLALVDRGNLIHRVLVDQAGAFIFGYDLVVEPVVNSKQFRVTVRPFSAEFSEQLRAGGVGTVQTSAAPVEVNTLPRATEAQLIDDGDAFALDLLVNSKAGVKIVDLVKVSFSRASFPESQGRPPARDFTLASVTLAVRDYRLLINEQTVAGGRQTSGAEGALVWFYVPGKGRFIFSLIPHQGYDFRKIGLIEDNKISFALGGDQYEWVSSAPVVGNGGSWNLWVLHDPAYIPVPDLFPPADNASRSARAGLIPSIISTLAYALPGSKGREQAGHPVRPGPQGTQGLDQTLRRARVSVGAADRIENLWPK